MTANLGKKKKSAAKKAAGFFSFGKAKRKNRKIKKARVESSKK